MEITIKQVDNGFVCSYYIGEYGDENKTYVFTSRSKALKFVKDFFMYPPAVEQTNELNDPPF